MPFPLPYQCLFPHNIWDAIENVPVFMHLLYMKNIFSIKKCVGKYANLRGWIICLLLLLASVSPSDLNKVPHDDNPKTLGAPACHFVASEHLLAL